MTVLLEGATLRLSGTCPSEDADVLLQHLLENPGASVDWTGCEQAHTAVVQVLLASRRVLKGPPAGNFLKDHVEGALRRAGVNILPSSSATEMRNT